MKPLRIVAVADTHTFESELAVPAGDVFVHAGDLLRAGTLEELAIVVEWLRALPHAHKVVVAGNHDWCFAREREAALRVLGGAVTYLEDSATTIAGLRFWGSPWQPEYNGWAFNLPRGRALEDKWRLIPSDTDVLITHGPPASYGDRTSVDGRAGCDDLLRAVRLVRPALHLFGHIHQDGSAWRDGDTLLANVTTWECERAPSCIEIEPDTRRVTPAVIPPARRPR